jgi:hypothetical protein
LYINLETVRQKKDTGIETRLELNIKHEFRSKLKYMEFTNPAFCALVILLPAASVVELVVPPSGLAVI